MRRALALVVLLVPAQALAQPLPELPSPSAPPAPPAPVGAPVPAPLPSTRVGLLLATGVDYRRIYDIGMVTGHLAVGLGIEQPGTRRTGFFGVEVQGGATEYGLPVVDYRVGGGLAWRFGRLRVGFGADVGWLTIARATSSSSAKTLWIGVYPLASFDIVDFGAGDAIYVAAKVGLDLIGAAPSPFVWGPTGELGVRF